MREKGTFFHWRGNRLERSDTDRRTNLFTLKEDFSIKTKLKKVKSVSTMVKYKLSTAFKLQ